MPLAKNKVDPEVNAFDISTTGDVPRFDTCGHTFGIEKTRVMRTQLTDKQVQYLLNCKALRVMPLRGAKEDGSDVAVKAAKRVATPAPPAEDEKGKKQK